MVCKLQSFALKSPPPESDVKPNTGMFRCFQSKFCNMMAVVMHVHSAGSAELLICYFPVIWTSPDCYAPSVAPPSCPPLTALVTHAVYSPRAEGKTGDVLHLLSKCCRVWIWLTLFFPPPQKQTDLVRLIVIQLCCSAVPSRSIVKVQQINKALHRNAFSF